MVRHPIRACRILSLGVLVAASGCRGGSDVVAVERTVSEQGGTGEEGGSSDSGVTGGWGGAGDEGATGGVALATGGSAGAAASSLGGSSGASTTETTGGSTGTGGSVPNPGTLELTGDLDAHDTCIIEANGTYYLFYSGPGLLSKTSVDFMAWQNSGSVFGGVPPSVAELVPNATNLWAPDVSWFGGIYHLYYAASTFGTGVSCIGHATSISLDPAVWVDQLAIVCSDLGGEDIDDWDAIDPSTISDTDGTRWMVFGSYGSGIKLIRLDAEGARDGDEFYSLARRPPDNEAVQAPFLFYRAPYYYLFVSFDACCAGVNSTYNIRVGRALEVTGEFFDRDGVSMLQGGGTLVLESNDRWHGVGANAIVTTLGADYNVYHSYDADANGRATLRISRVVWDDDGWPILGGP